jgi:hypothetical protein
MKKHIGLLSVLLGVGGIGMLLLSSVLGSSIVAIVGMVMLPIGIVGGLVSNAIEETNDATSWSTRSDDGLQKPTTDKGQLPLGGYTHGPR